MKGLYIAPLVAATLLLGACATTVKPTYVSPTQYQSLSCQNCKVNITVFNNISIMAYKLQKAQVWVLGLDLVVAGDEAVGDSVHPSLLIWGNLLNTKNTELSRVLGQQEAIVQAAQFKNCPIIVRKKAN